MTGAPIEIEAGSGAMPPPVRSARRLVAPLTWLGAAAALALVGVAWLFVFGPWRAVDLRVEAPAPQPPVLDTGDARPELWRARRSALLQAFEHDVYGAMPAPIAPVVARKQALAPERVGGVERVEQWSVEVGAAGRFHIAVVRPPGDAPAPVILVLNFCGNRAAFPGRPQAIAPPIGCVQWFCNAGALDPVVKGVFGRYINGPPFGPVAARGYALALVYAGDIVPDREAEARAALSRFAPADTGALMAWAWTASRALDALAADPRFDARRVALFGQSRQGKAALVAGAFDERFAAIIALQAGRGGDAPTAAFAGESVASMIRIYPHWFPPRFAAARPSVEQHQLIALIAPRPLLLGHARRDGWADPVGARAAGEAAAPVFPVLGAPRPDFFVRRGGHGVTAEDWRRTLDFLDARL